MLRVETRGVPVPELQSRDDGCGRARFVAALHRDHAPRLRSYVLSIVRDDLDAEDIVQEAFARLLKQLREGQVAEPGGFLFVLARNLALDLLRSHRRRLTTSLPDDTSLELAAPGAERAIDLRLEMDVLCRALAELPPRKRDAFIQRTVLGHSFRELSLSSGVPVSTLEKLVADGLRHCRRALSPTTRSVAA
jgi:RNA polymerase sigma-70 factor (ECF subfamily)